MTRTPSDSSLALLLMTVLGCGAPDRSAGAAADATTPFIRQVDHILIASTEANALFSLLSDTLQLPVAWPMSDQGGFASGGVSLGNVNLEILRSSEEGPDDARSRFVGFALEPEPLKQGLPGLEARGIRYGRPAPFRSIGTNGVPTTRWTTVGLPSVSHESTSVFLCAYEHDVAAARQESLAQLRARNGGPLTVQSASELVYGTADATGMQRQWQALLSPVEVSSPGGWLIGDGPALRVVRASEDGIVGIAISVASLARARQYLAARGWLGSERPGEITLGMPELAGLRITLVE